MNKKLSGISMISFMVHGMLGLRIMILPQTTAKYAKNDAWISVILMGLAVLLVCLATFWICDQYQGLNFPQIIEKLLGKTIGKILLTCMIIYNIFIISISIRYFAEGINTFLLETTPIYVVMITFLLVVYYCVMMDIRTISIIFDILLPFVLFFIILIILLSLSITEPKNLFPVLSGGPIPVVKGALNGMNIIVPSFVFSFLLPYVNKPKKAKKYIIYGIFISIFFSLMIVIICLMAFGEKEISYFTFPTLMLGKSIKLEYRIFERAETFFMAAWIPITLTNTVVYYIMTSLSIKQLFNTNKNNFIIMVQLPILFVAASSVKNIGQIPKLLSFANTAAIILVSVTLFMLLTMTCFKRKRIRNNSNSS